MAGTAGTDRPLIGIVAIVAAVATLTLMDTIGKHLQRSLPLIEVVWGRYAFNLLALLALLPIVRVRPWRTQRLDLQLWRAGLMLVATFTMFLSLRLLPLAETYAIAFLAPLLVALLAGPVLGERVGLARWLAVGAGFAGVLLVVRPGAGVIGLAALAPAAMALAYALYQLVTRVLAAHDGPFVTLFFSALIGTIVSTALLPLAPSPIPLPALALLAVMGVLGLLGQLLMVQAFALAPASSLAPYVYSQIVFAVPAGWLAFGDLPDGLTLLGSAVVVASGLALFWHEARSARRACSA